MSKDEIEAIASQQAAEPASRVAQRRLAEEVTELVHGKIALAAVQRVTDVMFKESNATNLSNDDLELLSHEIPTVELGGSVIDAVVGGALASSKSEARRLIEQGAITINGMKATLDSDLTVPSLIRRGKNRFALAK